MTINKSLELFKESFKNYLMEEIYTHYNFQSKNLDKLKNCPVNFKGDFDCTDNNLTTLEGCPKFVSGDFKCGLNQLITLKGAPEKINGYFDCSYNQLTSLKDSPKIVDGSFRCNHNKLTTLEGSPEEVHQAFLCVGNPLKSLKGCPKIVNGWFNCADCQQLEDISDLPPTVKDIDVECSPNIKVFPSNISTLTFHDPTDEVRQRIRNCNFYEVIEDVNDRDYVYITVKSKNIGNQLLDIL